MEPRRPQAPGLAEVDAPDADAIQVVVNLLADTIDPEALGAQIADLTISEIPELAKRADEDLRQTAVATATESLVDIWEALRARSHPV